MPTNPNPIPEVERFLWLDALRGLALVMMIGFHSIVLWRFWYGWPVDVIWNSWWYPLLGVSAALLFFLLSGAVSRLAFRRYRSVGRSPIFIVRRFSRRSSRIWLAALVVTLATWLTVPDYVVLFGTLHFLAVANLVLLPFLFLPPFVLPILGLVSVLAGQYLPLQLVERSLDYYPLWPWLGAVAAGAWLITIIPERWWQRALPPPLRPLAWIGQHTLIIYLLHVPILAGVTQLWLTLNG